MKTSNNGRRLIEGFEGLILQAYDDHNDQIVTYGQPVIGTLTIGYGHTDAAGPPKVYATQKITQAEADQFLATDLSAVENEVNHLVTVSLNQNQFDALVSFQFNTGALGKSSVLTLLNNKDYKGAAEHLLLYDHAGGRQLPGLDRRRQAEKALFLSTPVNNTSGPATGAVIIAAGAAAASQASPEYFWMIFGIIAIGALIIGLLVHEYSNTTQQKVN
jgi:lysozyme